MALIYAIYCYSCHKSHFKHQQSHFSRWEECKREHSNITLTEDLCHQADPKSSKDMNLEFILHILFIYHQAAVNKKLTVHVSRGRRKKERYSFCRKDTCRNKEEKYSMGILLDLRFCVIIDSTTHVLLRDILFFYLPFHIMFVVPNAANTDTECMIRLAAEPYPHKHWHVELMFLDVCFMCIIALLRYLSCQYCQKYCCESVTLAHTVQQAYLDTSVIRCTLQE